MKKKRVSSTDEQRWFNQSDVAKWMGHRIMSETDAVRFVVYVF